MSRIGEVPVVIPSGVTLTIDGQEIVVEGPKGKLSQNFHPSIKVVVEEGQVIVSRKRGNQLVRSMHGLTRTLISNMVTGVTDGWSKDLEMVGVGYRVVGGANVLTLS